MMMLRVAISTVFGPGTGTQRKIRNVNVPDSCYNSGMSPARFYERVFILKTKYLAYAIIPCIILGVLLLWLSNKENAGPKELLKDLDEGATLLIKVEGINKTEYYKLEDNHDLFELLNIEDWVQTESVGQIEKPYIVIRIGEGYEIVLSNDGLVYIENIYAAEESEKEASYKTSIKMEDIIDYVEKEAEVYDGQVRFNH